MADEQLARTKAINMRHVYVIGVIALARTRVPAGENSPTVSPPSISLYRTDLSFNVRPFLTSFSYYHRDFRATSLRNDYFLLLFFFLSFETKRCYRNGMEIDRSVAREERTRRFAERHARFAEAEM